MEIIEIALLLVGIICCFAVVNFISEKFFGVSFYIRHRDVANNQKNESFKKYEILVFSSQNPKAMEMIISNLKRKRYKPTPLNIHREITVFKRNNPQIAKAENDLITIVEKAQNELNLEKENRRSDYLAELNEKLDKGELTIDEAEHMLDLFDKYN